MRVSEIRVKQIRINQGLGVCERRQPTLQLLAAVNEKLVVIPQKERSEQGLDSCESLLAELLSMCFEFDFR